MLNFNYVHYSAKPEIILFSLELSLEINFESELYMVHGLRWN